VQDWKAQLTLLAMQRSEVNATLTLDSLEFYARDIAYPKHRIQYNWLYNISVGWGKHFGNNMSKALDAAVGGWQLAGSGSITSTYFAISNSHFGTFGKVQDCGTENPIMDCPSGNCERGYLWWNGCIPANQIGTAAVNQCPNGYVCGLPSSYTPAISPIVTDQRTSITTPNESVPKPLFAGAVRMGPKRIVVEAVHGP
jgi:hypothetical protein